MSQSAKDDEKRAAIISAYNTFRFEFSKNSSIPFMKELKWDLGLENEGKRLLSECKKLEHKENYRVYTSSHAVDPTLLLIAEKKFAEAVQLVNSRSEPFTNLLELIVPTQDKIACFKDTCHNNHEICLLGPNGKIHESDFGATSNHSACTSIFFAFSLLLISFFLS
uniref:Uncharacterized protein n=1 Tax=Caenorhabditis japonica TaxID=281687 RepID=A0A8R1EMT7_CAEJA